MMYCEDCGELFWEPNYRCWTEAHGEPWAVMICPYCESEEVYHAVKCEGCGEYFPPDELTDGVCQECGKDTNDR